MKTKRNVRKVEKVLKYELRRREVEAMNITAKALEDAARRHINKILSWGVNKFRGVVNLDFSQLKIGTWRQLVIRKALKRYGQNILRMC